MRKKIILLILIFIMALINAKEKYKLIVDEDNSFASSFVYKIIDQKENPVKLPVNIQKILQDPFFLGLHNSELIFYSGEFIKLYNLDTKKEKKLLNIDYNNIDGFGNPIWSQDNKKIMFVVIDQQHKNGFKDMCRIIVLFLDKNRDLVNKKQYDKPVNFSCGSICLSEANKDYMFVDNNTIKYKRHEIIDDRPGIFEIIKIE